MFQILQYPLSTKNKNKSFMASNCGAAFIPSPAVRTFVAMMARPAVDWKMPTASKLQLCMNQKVSFLQEVEK